MGLRCGPAAGRSLGHAGRRRAPPRLRPSDAALPSLGSTCIAGQPTHPPPPCHGDLRSCQPQEKTSGPRGSPPAQPTFHLHSPSPPAPSRRTPVAGPRARRERSATQSPLSSAAEPAPQCIREVAQSATKPNRGPPRCPRHAARSEALPARRASPGRPVLSSARRASPAPSRQEPPRRASTREDPLSSSPRHPRQPSRGAEWRTSGPGAVPKRSRAICALTVSAGQ